MSIAQTHSISQLPTISIAELEAAASMPVEFGGYLRKKFEGISSKTLAMIVCAHRMGHISLYDLAIHFAPLPQLLGEIRRRMEWGQS